MTSETETVETVAIDRCPCCGGQPRLAPAGRKNAYVACACGMLTKAGRPADVVAIWNRRAADPA